MAQYRKKPVVIEARLLTNQNTYSISNWINSESTIKSMPVLNSDKSIYGLDIPTLEGTMQAHLGDYIIKGINGEFYPCKPDIFEKTYELVE